MVPDDYSRFSGTSIATPHVAAGAAILMTDDFSNTEARGRLNETAEDFGLSAIEQGNGMVDVPAVAKSDGNGVEDSTIRVGEDRKFSEMNEERSGRNVGSGISANGESDTFLDADRGVAVVEV